MGKTRRIDITIGANADKKSFDDSQKRLDQFMDKIESGSRGATDRLSQLLLTTGGMEAGFRVAGAAAAIFSGDLGAMRSALERIPGGLGPAIAAFNELSDVWNADTEALKVLREELAATVSAANDGIKATLSLEQNLDRAIRKAQGRQFVSDQFLNAQASADRLRDQVTEVFELTEKVRRLEREAGGAINLQPIDLGAVVDAFQSRDIAKGLVGSLGLVPLFADAEFNAIAQAIDEIGISSDNSGDIIDALIRRMAEMEDQADTLIDKAADLDRINEQAADRTRQERIDAIANKIETENRLLAIDDEFERKRERLRLTFADRIAKAESERIADALRDRLRIELATIQEAEIASLPFVGPILPSGGGDIAGPSPHSRASAHPRLPSLSAGRLIIGAAVAGRSGLQSARERREQREQKEAQEAQKSRDEQSENLKEIVRLLDGTGVSFGTLLSQ